MYKKILSLCFFILLLSGCSNDSLKYDEKDLISTNPVLKTKETKKIVVLKNKLYYETPYVLSFRKCGTSDGKIRSSVKKYERPQKNEQSNFGTGFNYQYYGKGLVVLEIDNKAVLFSSVDKFEMPYGVANFVGKIKSEKPFIVEILEKPKFCFGKEFENKNEFEIDINSLYRLGNEILPISNFKNKKLKIWFNGKLENNKINDVYKIDVLD